jgi:hypothetical protein
MQEWQYEELIVHVVQTGSHKSQVEFVLLGKYPGGHGF